MTPELFEALVEQAWASVNPGETTILHLHGCAYANGLPCTCTPVMLRRNADGSRAHDA